MRITSDRSVFTQPGSFAAFGDMFAARPLYPSKQTSSQHAARLGICQ